MLGMFVQLADSMRSVLQHAPTNRLLRRLHLRGGLLPAVVSLLAGVAYLLGAVACTVLLDRGEPGWLNVLVLVFIWNSCKLVLHGLAMLVSSARTRLSRRRASRVEASTETLHGGLARPR